MTVLAPSRPAPQREPRTPSTTAADVARSIGDTGYANIVLDRLARQTCEVMEAEQSCIVVNDRRDPQRAIAAAAFGMEDDVVGSRVRPAAGETCLYPSDRRTASAPIVHDGSVRGLLTARSTDRWRRFDIRELKLLTELAELVGEALGRLDGRQSTVGETRRRLEQSARALDRHDGGTWRHSTSVVPLALAVGDRLGMGDAPLLELELAALLHDVGKIAVPEDILRKPGALDGDERRLIQQHPEWGADLLRHIPGLEAVSSIVRFHHERWDGRGYPHALAAERIPAASRIVGACDAYDAMTSDRPYRKSMGMPAAIGELRRNAGSQFDPKVVDVLSGIVMEMQADRGER